MKVGKSEEFLCSICRGVNQHCDKHLDKLCQKVAEKGFEFEDFKITFSISIISYINKILILSELEQAIGKPFLHASKDIQRVSIPHA